ncbi:hypothetical protein [Oceanibaculum pacificum]|uniref:Uncharacterized protein n=1 Tax=Oceanibaculum pacificum TaxID=580166 RepID=A0A154WEK6_9PROT|nr:hypothetical protein [Oceanibaculum pacificum]KZD11958.1 hypothetical protein AUP43_05640 [Oceanibaculum pacificum]
MGDIVAILLAVALAALVIAGPLLYWFGRRMEAAPARPPMPVKPAAFARPPAESAPQDGAIDARQVTRDITQRTRKRRQGGLTPLVERDPEAVARLLSGMIRDPRDR